jgi:hypothetical protein
VADSDAERVLHEELARLPESHRAAILLCFFEGLTHAEAARRLGVPVGTVAGRMARAKETLAARLTRRVFPFLCSHRSAASSHRHLWWRPLMPQLLSRHEVVWAFPNRFSTLPNGSFACHSRKRRLEWGLSCSRPLAAWRLGCHPKLNHLRLLRFHSVHLRLRPRTRPCRSPSRCSGKVICPRSHDH